MDRISENFLILIGISFVLTWCVLMLCVYLEARINRLQDQFKELKNKLDKLERLDNARK